MEICVLLQNILKLHPKGMATLTEKIQELTNGKKQLTNRETNILQKIDIPKIFNKKIFFFELKYY